MRDEMSGELAALVDAARGGDDPIASDRERVRRALLARLGAGALVATTAATASAATTGATTAVAGGVGVFAKVMVVALVATTGLGLGAAAYSSRHAHRAAAHAAHAPVVTAPRALERTASTAPPTPAIAPAEAPASVVAPAAAPAEPAPAPPSLAASATTATRPPRAAPVVDDTAHLAEDLASLARARALIAQHHPADALLEIEHHTARYPTSELASERRVERAIALCDLGRVDEGRRELARVAREAPEHPDLPSAREACGADAP